jgi:tetratricopeptide (TPR) repeat protein
MLRYAWAYDNRGLAYYRKGDYDKAISDYSNAIETNPKLAKPYNNRGLAYYYKGLNYKACSDFKWACELGFCKGYEFAKREGDCG